MEALQCYDELKMVVAYPTGYHRIKGRLQRLTLKKLVRRIRRLLFEQAEDRMYRMTPAEALQLPNPALTRKDSLEDLQLVSPPDKSREAQIEEWQKRLRSGEHCYTITRNGALVSYGWMIERQVRCYLPQVSQYFDFPPNSAVLYDFYIDLEHRRSNFYQASLIEALHDAANTPGTEWIYCAVLADDAVPRWWVERLGFTYLCSHFYKRVLWRTRKWRS